MESIKIIQGRVVIIPQTNIDTDTITPARFLKITGKDKERLKLAFFHDWRFNKDGSPKPDFPLNRPEYRGAEILLAGGNFGCGSSREHAPWATLAFGIRAVISTSIADIYRQNSLKNGLLPVLVDETSYMELFNLIETDPKQQVVIDLEKQKVMWCGSRSCSFPIDPFSKKCLLQGVDQLGYLLSHEAKIAEFERRRY